MTRDITTFPYLDSATHDLQIPLDALKAYFPSQNLGVLDLTTFPSVLADGTNTGKLAQHCYISDTIPNMSMTFLMFPALPMLVIKDFLGRIDTNSSRPVTAAVLAKDRMADRDDENELDDSVVCLKNVIAATHRIVMSGHETSGVQLACTKRNP